MKKFILVVFIGIVLGVNLYGCVNEILIDDRMKEVDHVKETTTAVYVE